MNNNRFVKFYDKEESDIASYKNRIESLNTYDKYLYDNILFKNGFIPSDDLRKFLRIQVRKATSEKDVLSKKSLIPTTSKLLEDNSMIRSMDKLKILNYIQLFLDNYMSPLNSDIRYRLGEVTATKVFQCDTKNRSIIYDDDKDGLDSLAQYDKFGRMDTSSNFRNIFHIDGTDNGVIPRYDEYYVNWFFPPFDKSAFEKTTTDFLDDFNIDKKKWDGDSWNYYNKDSNLVTFDKESILSLRDKPTYRGIAFKPINDNISFLQYIFEQCTGIVSTYLTEWDLSLYIQEGLLSKKYDSRNSLISLNNRIFYDNPLGYKNECALSFGVLNAAISKTPQEGGIVSNTSSYLPYAYPLSIYWWPYNSINRGDGLDNFYNVAIKGFPDKEFTNKLLKDKLRWYDDLGAAYSGWKNWDNLKNYQSLYTNDEDGFSSIDMIHMNECIEDMKFASDPIKETKGEIEQIIDSLYENDKTLGISPEEWDVDTTWKENEKTYKLSKHYKRNKINGEGIFQYAVKSCTSNSEEKEVYYKNQYDLEHNIGSDRNDISIDIGECGDIRILGIRIPGSGLLRMFLRRSSIKDKIMGIADKAANGYSSSFSSSSKKSIKGNNRDAENSKEFIGTNNENYLSDKMVSMLGADEEEPSRYSRQDGVSQWSPMLYGGPHGKYASPKTIQGYFEVDNPFLRNVPRMYSGKDDEGNFSLKTNNFMVKDGSNLFKNNESFYNIYKNSRDKYDDLTSPSRSPSKCMNLLNRGFFDYTLYPVRSLKKIYVTIEVEGSYDSNNSFYTYYYKPYSYNGHRLYYENDYYYYNYVESNTYFLSPYSLVCLDYNICPHHYSTGWQEWEDYYRYAKSNEYYFKEYYDNGFKSRYIFGYYYRNRYILKKNTLMRYYSAYYLDWATVEYKRPLMHSNPNEYWSISRTNKYTISTTRVDNFWRSSWLNFCAFWTGARYVESSYLVYTMNPPEEVFRLTFPRSGIISSEYRDVIQKDTGKNYPYTITYAEKDFIENVLNNTKNRLHKVLFFASKGNEYIRDKYGPDMIFSADCYLDTYNYKCRYMHWYSYRHKCHTDWDWYWDEGVHSAQFICVDINNMNKSDLILSGIRPDVGLPVSNLGITKNLSDTDNYMDRDVPPENSKTTLYSTPIMLETNIPKSDYVSFAGYAKNTHGEQGFHGWGYSTTLPGLNPNFEHEEGNYFEDPNDYLNLKVKYSLLDWLLGLQNLSFNSLISEWYFPFYHISKDAKTIYPTSFKDDTIVYSDGVYGYERWPSNSPKIRGLMVALRNCFTSSTFFKADDTKLEENFRPCIVTNDCMLRTAVRAALHQKSYLQQAKAILEDNINFDSMKSIIENKIDKEILNKTIDLENKDTQSVFYHYWIDKAYTIFSDSNKKEEFITKFNEKIEYLNMFIKDSTRLVGKEIGMWSYNDFIKSLDNLESLKENFLTSKKEKEKNVALDEFMYSYLSVLYEYRKYFINKRCNKVDGTLWILRSLESALPMISEVIDDGKGGGLGDDNPSTSGLGNNVQYKVDFYKTTNGATEKVRAAYRNEPLENERTKTLFIKVKYVSSDMAKKYLKGIKDGTWKESEKGRLVYIKQNQRWAELPFDDEYRYVSKEYYQTLANIKFNEKSKKIADINKTTPELRSINKLVDGISNDRCVFNIKWTLTGGLNTFNEYKDNKFFNVNEDGSVDFTDYPRDNSKQLNLSNFLNLYSRFPYTYEAKESSDPIVKNDVSIPSILFDVNTGINIEKAEELAKAGNDLSEDVLKTLCQIKETADFWCVPIPENARPLSIGYKKGLFLKTELEDIEKDENLPYPNNVTSTTGSFGYALYPITEEQANNIPGIGIDMENISLKLRDSINKDLKAERKKEREDENKNK